MATFHLNDGRWRSYGRQLRRRARPEPGANAAIISDWITSTALCVGAAALVPTALMPWVLAALLNVVGYVWLGLAITQTGQPFGRDHLNAWDAALFSFAASFGVQAAAHLGIFNT